MEPPAATKKFEQAVNAALNHPDPIARARVEAIVKAAKEDWGQRLQFISLHSFTYGRLLKEGLIVQDAPTPKAG